ncbi:MAG TPA: succinic semialdehyde dehydrogenase [Thermoanaerobaculia bacterium]
MATPETKTKKPARTLDTIPVVNPATGEEVGAVPATPPAGVAEAVVRARAAQRRWAERSFAERAAVLRRFHDTVLDEADRVLDTIQRESGKARRDALSEVVTVAGTARYYVAHGEGHLADERRQAAVPGLTSARVAHKPLGVCGLITPWNFPFLLSVADALPALLAGNAVVVKPSEVTPLSAELGREMLIASGLHPDLFQLVHGDGAELGPALIGAVDYVGFTGSTAVGRKVAVAAAERLIPFSLELGGKNPMIVLADAPLEDAVTGFVSGAMCNTGQSCISIERVYVERGIYDRYVEALVERVRGLQVGWSLGWELDMGSLISRKHTEKVWSHVEDAVARGATVLAGGELLPDLGPTFIAPTLLTDTTPEMKLSCEETFGPVVSIEAVDSAEEAVEKANATRYGLNASIWAGDTDRALRLARRLETGSANVNATLLIYNSFDAPMGGVKESGLGRRHGPHGIRRYTQEQALVESTAAGGGYEALLVHTNTPRKAKALLQAFRLWRKVPFIR